MRTHLVVVLGAFIGVALPARAGQKTANAVHIDDRAKTASGTMGAARASLNNVELIECQTNSDEVGAQSLSWCSATDADGTSRVCYALGAPAALQTMTANSQIAFGWDGNMCRYINIRNSSTHLPVTP